jgi:hypothetical protein
MPGPVADLFAHVTHLLAKGGLWLGVGISVVLAIGSIALVVLVVIKWPADHFKPHIHGAAVPRHWLASIAKNVAGVILILLGLVMALPGIPGQGFLTMIVGLTMLDFPGKLGLERRLIGRPRILRTLNKLRARFHRAPLEMT